MQTADWFNDGTPTFGILDCIAQDLLIMILLILRVILGKTSLLFGL